MTSSFKTDKLGRVIEKGDLLVKAGYDYEDPRYPHQRVSVYTVIDIALFAIFIELADSPKGKHKPFALADTSETYIVQKYWDRESIV